MEATCQMDSSYSTLHRFSIHVYCCCFLYCFCLVCYSIHRAIPKSDIWFCRRLPALVIKS